MKGCTSTDGVGKGKASSLPKFRTGISSSPAGAWVVTSAHEENILLRKGSNKSLEYVLPILGLVELKADMPDWKSVGVYLLSVTDAVCVDEVKYSRDERLVDVSFKGGGPAAGSRFERSFKSAIDSPCNNFSIRYLKGEMIRILTLEGRVLSNAPFHHLHRWPPSRCFRLSDEDTLFISRFAFGTNRTLQITLDFRICTCLTGLPARTLCNKTADGQKSVRCMLKWCMPGLRFFSFDIDHWDILLGVTQPQPKVTDRRVVLTDHRNFAYDVWEDHSE